MVVVLSSMVVSLLSIQNFHMSNLGDRLPHTLLKVYSAHKDKVEIKCMGSFGGKHQQNQNFIYSSLALGSLNHDKVDIMCIHSYNMDNKIRRMMMNGAFEYI